MMETGPGWVGAALRREVGARDWIFNAETPGRWVERTDPCALVWRADEAKRTGVSALHPLNPGSGWSPISISATSRVGVETDAHLKARLTRHDQGKWLPAEAAVDGKVAGIDRDDPGLGESLREHGQGAVTDVHAFIFGHQFCEPAGMGLDGLDYP